VGNRCTYSVTRADNKIGLSAHKIYPNLFNRIKEKRWDGCLTFISPDMTHSFADFCILARERKSDDVPA
jgi:hypothetical protein